MKINSDLDPQGGHAAGGASATGATAARNAGHAPQPSPSSSGDKAEISSEGQLLATLSTQAASQPAVRQDRVASLRQAIQSGTHNVSNQQIAQSMQKDLGPAA